jgi:hypothetical protein
MANLNLNREISGSNNKITTNKVFLYNSIMAKYKAPFMIYHQNIRSIQDKTDKLLRLWFNEYPHILCFSEHHLQEQEISKLCCSPYILAAKYCRNKSKAGGVCIYVHESLSFIPIDLEKYCKEHEIEVCAVKLDLMPSAYCIISVYRSQSGNIAYFISALDSVLNKLHSTSINLILCGDMNINYLGSSNNKTQLVSLLPSYSLYNIVDFPTRIDNKSSTAIDGIFINKNTFYNYSISEWVI